MSVCGPPRADNAVTFQSSHTLSSVGTAVLANMKIVVLLALSALLLGEMSNWSARQVGGLVLSLGGTMAYSWFKLQAKLRPRLEAGAHTRGRGVYGVRMKGKVDPGAHAVAS